MRRIKYFSTVVIDEQIFKWKPELGYHVTEISLFPGVNEKPLNIYEFYVSLCNVTTGEVFTE